MFTIALFGWKQMPVGPATLLFSNICYATILHSNVWKHLDPVFTLCWVVYSHYPKDPKIIHYPPLREREKRSTNMTKLSKMLPHPWRFLPAWLQYLLSKNEDNNSHDPTILTCFLLLLFFYLLRDPKRQKFHTYHLMMHYVVLGKTFESEEKDLNCIIFFFHA